MKFTNFDKFLMQHFPVNLSLAIDLAFSRSNNEAMARDSSICSALNDDAEVKTAKDRDGNRKTTKPGVECTRQKNA